jgi:hypothetical protein
VGRFMSRPVRTCAADGCDRSLSRQTKGDLCRSCRMRAMQNDPARKAMLRERFRVLMADPGRKAKAAERLRSMRADAAMAARNADLSRARATDAAWRASVAAAARERETSPEWADWRAARAARLKALHADPDFAAGRDARIAALLPVADAARRRAARERALARRMTALHLADSGASLPVICARLGQRPAWCRRFLRALGCYVAGDVVRGPALRARSRREIAQLVEARS